MREELFERLEIMENANLISSAVSNYCMDIIKVVYDYKNTVDGDKMAIFITHLAIASQRVNDGRSENPIDESIIELLVQEEIYPEAMTLLDVILKNEQIVFPESEIGYLKIHLCNLVKD